MAGESASESARRQREKADRLQRSAEMYERGAEGERRTAEVLAGLPSDAWTVFHDLRWPGRRFANVDHIVVGPPGVFVIDSKNWAGTIRLRHNVLSSNGYPKEREVSGAAEAALAIGQLVPLLRPDLVLPVLCFVRDEPISGWARHVMVTSTSTLLEMLTSGPPALSPQDVRHVALDLDGGIRAATAAPEEPRPRHEPAAVTSAGRPPRPPSPSRPRTKKGRSKSPSGALVPLIIAVVAVAVLLGNPSMVAGVSGWFADLFTSTVHAPAQEKDKKERTNACEKASSKPRCRPRVHPPDARSVGVFRRRRHHRR
jgi:hypothetical protein